jgi:formylglycine-generating enzyme required for sulfatase activity
MTPENYLDLKLEPIEVVTVNSYGEIIQRQQRIAKYLIEDLSDGITLEMAKIPGGTFMMGSPEGEGKDNEKPQHEVNIQPFFMGKFPITQAQWKAVVSFPKAKIDLKPDPYPSGFKGANYPVENIYWSMGVEFCDRLSKRTKRKYRLPSETEWEYGCRAGTTTPFHFGETITKDLANYDGNAYGDGGITEVGSFGVANNFGLYDMHGNTYEWCQDMYYCNYKDAPINGSAWINENDKQARVLRGGSWGDDAELCRSASRDGNTTDLWYYSNGFRVVLSDDLSKGPASRCGA